MGIFKRTLFGHWALLFLLFYAYAPLALAAKECAANGSLDELATVAHVYDGDTVKLRDGRKVRIVGINTPELARDGTPSQPFAQQALDLLRQLLKSDRTVGLRYAAERHDRYGRLLANIYLADGRDVAVQMLKQGLATLLVVPPNVQNFGCYQHIEQRARNARLGIWALPAYQTIETRQLERHTKGYRIIRGKISRIGESRRSIWLNFPGKVALRIDRRDLAYFTGVVPQDLLHCEVIARGWLHRRKGELRMNVRHPAALERLNKTLPCR